MNQAYLNRPPTLDSGLCRLAFELAFADQRFPECGCLGAQRFES
jgi:hypothetical protein